MKKLLAGLLALLLLFGLLPGALAASEEAEQAAEALYARGLFRGTGEDAAGAPVFELDRAMNRSEAVTMLVRLLGKEGEALAGSWSLPFADVPQWAAAHVGYAYANGLTNGVGEGRFGGADTVDAAQYTAFLLRSLGYASAVDFHWADTLSFAAGLGLTPPAGPFDRGAAAIMTLKALGLKLKGREVTLSESLAGAPVEPPLLSTAVLEGRWTSEDGSRAWAFTGDRFTSLAVTAQSGGRSLTSLRRGSYALTDGALSLRFERLEYPGELLWRERTEGQSEALSVSMPAGDVLLIGEGSGAPVRLVRTEEDPITPALAAYEGITAEALLPRLRGWWSHTGRYTRPDGSTYEVRNEVMLDGSVYELALSDSTGYQYYERGSFRPEGTGLYPTTPTESYGLWQGELAQRAGESGWPGGFSAALFLAYGYTHSDTSLTGLIAAVKAERAKLNDPEYAASLALGRDYTALLKEDLAELRGRRSGAAAQSACYAPYYDLNGDLVVATAISYTLSGSSFYAYYLHNVTQGWSLSDPIYHYRDLAGKSYGEAKLVYIDLADEVQKHIGAAQLGREGARFSTESLGA